MLLASLTVSLIPMLSIASPGFIYTHLNRLQVKHGFAWRFTLIGTVADGAQCYKPINKKYQHLVFTSQNKPAYQAYVVCQGQAETDPVAKDYFMNGCQGSNSAYLLINHNTPYKRYPQCAS